jgi:glycerol-3-phosphate O-acyltransferase / dihydroxyacetone phosphate acyltransferase
MASSPDRVDRFYAVVRAIARFWLWFFWKRVDVRSPERVPASGPVLLCINHPNNLIDSLLVGAVLRRKVHYLATSALFRNPLVARFLAACGAVPVYRKQDDPGRMDRNTDTFSACVSMLVHGRLIGIYPEGTTHSEARVQRIKTGAARIALEYEAGRPTRGGEPLALVPVGLTFEARKAFSGRVRVSFGEPLSLAGYLAAYRDDPVKAVDALTTAIHWAMQAEIVHVSRLDRADLVRVIEDLYRGDLVRELQTERGLGEQHIDTFRLSQSIADAVAHFQERDPERVERIAGHVGEYRAMLAAYRVRDVAVRARLEGRWTGVRVRHSWQASAGLPLFAYGAVVNFLPYYVPRFIARRFADRETSYATTRLLSAIVAFPLFWSLEIWIVWHIAGSLWATAFAASLPLSGVLAYRYLSGAGRLRTRMRFGVLALTRRAAASRLLAARRTIIAELDRAKTDYLAATKGSTY